MNLYIIGKSIIWTVIGGAIYKFIYPLGPWVGTGVFIAITVFATLIYIFIQHKIHPERLKKNLRKYVYISVGVVFVFILLVGPIIWFEDHPLFFLFNSLGNTVDRLFTTFGM